MKTKMVRYTLQTLPKLSEADIKDLKKLAARPEREIDFSDIPEMTEERFNAAKLAGHVMRGGFYRPLKKQVSARLDADVLHWLKKEGRGYQSRMNAILRREMLASLDAGAKTDPEPRRSKAAASRR